MILLAPDKYNLAIPALSKVISNNLFARSVVERHVTGEVYADNGAEPRAFYIIHPYGMSLLFGEISDDVLHFLRNYLTGSNDVKNSTEYLQVFPSELENSIDDVFGEKLCIFNSDEQQDLSGHAAVKYKRINFAFNPEKFKAYLSGVDLKQYHFCEVDEFLFYDFNGSVVPKKFWDNAGDFARHGTGYSLMLDNQAAATAFSSFRHDDMLELGMETRIELRRKGFGAIVCSKLIEHCLRSNLEPVWACGSGNPASHNLAVKLGFEPVASLPYYVIRGHCRKNTFP